LTASGVGSGSSGAEPVITGGHSPKKGPRKRPLVVEIDKQFFVVNSLEEAQALLDQALALAAEQAVNETERVVKETLKKPIRIKRLKALKRPVIETKADALAPIVQEFKEKLDRIYTDAIDAAIEAEMLRKIVDEDEEDTIIAMLLG
jgi:hypothetical protein